MTQPVSTTLIHEYYYLPKMNNLPYDPDERGGEVAQLRLYRVESNTLIAEIGPASRISYGVYRFDIPDTVPEDVYLGEVTWSRTDTSPDLVDRSLVVSVPSRTESQIKPWITLRELINYHPDVRGIPADIALDVIDVATQILYGLSGRKYRGSRIVNELYSCSHGGGCRSFAHAMGYSHNRRSHDAVVQLRGRPAQRVLQVSLDSTGDILSPSTYRLVNARYLEPTQGQWSPCQGVRVTYAYGVEPTRLARSAALALAGNLALAHQGSEACRLPARTTSVSRQGLSFSVLDPQDFLQDGRTGLYEVDLFLKTVNPDKARSRPRVLLPDGPRSRSVATVTDASYVSIYSLTVVPGEPIDVTFSWRTYGAPNPVTGIWEVRARAGSVDLAPFVTVEAGDEPGRIDLNVPADVAALLEIGSSWYLEVVRLSDATQVQRLLTGDVQRAT